jgi:hypothetical protein
MTAIVLAQLTRNPEIKGTKEPTRAEQIENEAREIKEKKITYNMHDVTDRAIYILQVVNLGKPVNEAEEASRIWQGLTETAQNLTKNYLKFKENAHLIRYTPKDIEVLCSILQTTLQGQLYPAISRNTVAETYNTTGSLDDATYGNLVDRSAFKESKRVLTDEAILPFVQKVKEILLKKISE